MQMKKIRKKREIKKTAKKELGFLDTINLE